MKGGETELNAQDAELLSAFASMQGIDTTTLIHMAMTALATQIRLQIPHCAHCPHWRASQNQAHPTNVLNAKFR
jgi:hypothetical protein